MVVDTSTPTTTTTTSTSSTIIAPTQQQQEGIPTSPVLSGSMSSSSSSSTTHTKPIDCPKKEKVDEDSTSIIDTTKLASTPPTKSMPSSPMSPSSPINSDNEMMVLENMTVRIQKRPNTNNTNETEVVTPTYETVKLAELRLPMDPTLEDIRTALTQCELGDARRDIFFPAWTKSLYVSVNGEEETVEKDEQLREVLQKEQEKSGTVVLQLQECRNARYSRRKRNTRHRRDGMNATSTPIFVPPMYMMGEPTARADQPVYFDRPMAYYPYNIGGEITFLPPPFIVPFPMYSNNQ